MFTDMKRLGSNIEWWRKLRGYTQVDLSKRTATLGHKVDQGFISSIEKGRKNPSVLTLQAIAQALNITLTQLEEGKPEPSPNAISGHDAAKLLAGWTETDAVELLRIGQLVPPDRRGYFLRHIRRIIPTLLDVIEDIQSDKEQDARP